MEDVQRPIQEPVSEESLEQPSPTLSKLEPESVLEPGPKKGSKAWVEKMNKMK